MRSPFRAPVRTLVAATLVVVPVAAPSAAVAATPIAEPESVATELASHAPDLLRRYSAAGASVAVVDHGVVVSTSGYGVADRSTGARVTPDTVFEVGSISKTVTAWGVLRLAEQGRINLDAPVSRYVPDWHPPPSRFDPGAITVRRLLSHTAGLSVQGYSGYPVGSPVPTLEESLAGRGGPAVRLVDRPGTRFHYSGGGYAVLQLLVERVSGRPFADYMRDEVLLPLGMTSSSYVLTPDIAAHLAAAYSAGNHRVATRVYPEAGADGLLATAPDLARFLSAAASGGGGVLSPATVALSLQPAPHTTDAGALGPGTAYGLGTFLEPVAGTMLAYHPGLVRGWAGMYALRPDTGQAVVVLTNSDTGMHVAGDLTCVWARSTVGGAPQYCRALARARTSTVAVSGALTAAIAGYLAWVGWELANRRRRMAVRPSRGPGALVRAAVSLGAAAAWVVVWHTDAIPAHVFQDEVVPARLMPSAFLWTSYAFVAACVALAVTRFTVPTSARPMSRAQVGARLAVPVLAALVWTVVWGTDLGTRLILSSTDLVPARALHSLDYLTWAVPSACVLWGAARLPVRSSNHA